MPGMWGRVRVAFRVCAFGSGSCGQGYWDSKSLVSLQKILNPKPSEAHSPPNDAVRISQL